MYRGPPESPSFPTRRSSDLSSDPNLQNIPVRTPRGEAIRRAFVAPPGAMLLTADYSQIELRLLAHLSRDPAFVEAFEQDRKSTRLNSSHGYISYAVFCLKKK